MVSTPRLLQQCITWLTGFSVSSVIIFFILFLVTIILRRKGYGVRLGVACVVLYARPGSRRFPDGVQVRLTTRIVGFLVGGCRGPWLDVYSERFCMRLRPSTSAIPLSRRLPPAMLRLPLLRASAAESKYWLLIIQNALMRLFAFWVRGLRIRVEKVRIWKDAGHWDCKGEQFVFCGRASGLFGSHYSLSMNALQVNFCKQPAITSTKLEPICVTLTLEQGIEISAHLVPRVVTLFRCHRLAILDDLRVCVNLNHVLCHASQLLEASISKISVELCPGYSRSLLAKLPSLPPPAKRPRQRSIIQFFETIATLKTLSVRFSLPRTSASSQSIDQPRKPTPSSQFVSGESPIHSYHVLRASQTSNFGGFVRIDSLCFEAYGKTGDERFEGMMHSSVSLRGCSAGSASVDTLSRALYESASDGVADAETPNAEQSSGNIESEENIEKIIAAKPEAMLWVEDVSTAIDINVGSGKNLTKRVDIAGSGCVVALEPLRLNTFVDEASYFVKGYITHSRCRTDAHCEDESDNSSAASRNGSSNSLPSLGDEQTSLRLVSDLRHWKILVLGDGAVEEGDTVALFASADAIVLSQMDVVSSSLLCVKGSVGNFEGAHWSRWDRTKNVTCGKCHFDIRRGSIDNKKLTVKDLCIAWDLDFQTALEKLPVRLRSLKRPRNFRRSPGGGPDGTVWVELPPPPRNEHDRIHLSEAERLARREKRHSKFLDNLRVWELEAENVSTTFSFPDGPKLGLSVGILPVFRLNSETFVGRHVVCSLQDRKCAYAAVLKLGSFFHTMSKNLEKRSININAQTLHIVLEPESQFGYLLQDWLLRIRSAIAILREARWRNRGLVPPKAKKVPMADIHFTSSDLEIHFEDHPVSGFLTVMLPLMQDEARERVNRDLALESQLEKLRKLARAEIAGTPLRCVHALRQKDSEIWIERVRKMKRESKTREIGNGLLPSLERPPAASFTASSLCLDVTLDDLARQMGSTESIRRLRMLDDYELGSKIEKKSRQYDRDAWNSIGFRAVGFEATNVCIQLRDYPRPFIRIDRMYFDNTTMGQAVQATTEPYICKTRIALGRRRVAEVVKALAPTKTFADIHLKVDTLDCVFNPSYLAGISDFGRGVSRFFGGGRDPSPRIPWFDSLRVSMHGRMRLSAKKFKGLLTSSVSPYSTTSHFVNFESDNFEMLSSRLNPTEEDRFPISWKFNKWRIYPSTFDESRRSQIVFDFVRVGIKPILTVDCGDPQDHYFVPFPSKEEVAKGGPGIGKGSVTLCNTDEPVGLSDDGFGSFTIWRTGLDKLPGADTFAGFKTRGMEMCVDIQVRHPKPKSHWSEACRDKARLDCPPVQLPRSHSIAYSDAISTLTKVVRSIIRRPISCRLPPRQLSLNRKPPSVTGLSSSLKKMHITVDAKNVNVMLHNNLEPGHSLFLSVDSLEGELRKETKITSLERGEVVRTSRATKRSFVIKSIYSSIRVPGLDFAVDGDDTGKLLTIDKVSFFDNINNGTETATSPFFEGGCSPSSGFGSEDLDDSPFYTFSATHPLQRGSPLDKVVYNKCLLVDHVRLIWSPARRISMFAWPDAFKLKTFSMKASKIGIVDKDVDLQVTGFGHAEVAKGMDILNTGENILSSVSAGNSVNDIQQPVGSANISNEKAAEKVSNGESSFEDAMAYGPSCALATEAFSDVSGLKSPVLPFSRSKVMIKKKHVGSMVDLLHSHDAGQSLPLNVDHADASDSDSQSSKHACGVFEILSCKPKLSVHINDCEVGFGSHETSGTVFLTSRSVRVGIVDKRLQKAMQLGETNEEWADREYRFHLEAANVFTRDKKSGGFNFNRMNWVTSGDAPDPSFALVTQKPICMDLMYISSSSILSNDEDEDETEDYTLRPKLLFINIPNIKLSTNASEFHAITDVVRKVLMQSMRSSELVNEELSKLRYKLQLAGGKVSTEDLEVSMQRLDCVTRQFLYAGDTFQQHLVEPLMLPNEDTFYDNLLRYKAKAKALATFMRKDIGATSANVLFPTMYISYSFDEFSWELREKHKELNREVEDPFVEMALENLVCRHVFYVGRGSSAEVTFANISAQNKMRSSYFQRILQPAGSATNYGAGEGNMKISKIKASDGAAVAFRWYSTQEDHVGGISVYDLLTIQVAPMTAAVTRKLYSSVSGFVFSTLGNSSTEEGLDPLDESQLSGPAQRDVVRTTHAESSSSLGMVASRTISSESVTAARGSRANVVLRTSKVDEVVEMAHRGEKNMLFKYVFIDAFELTASYKNKESTSRGALDFFDLSVRTPTFSYSSEIWTWKAFANQVKKDLVKTFVLRGVSNLAKLKLLPGYNHAKKKLARGADTVRETIYNHLPTGNSGIGQEPDVPDDDEEVHDALRSEDSDESIREVDAANGDDPQREIDAAIDDISGEEDSKRENVLIALYGLAMIKGSGKNEVTSPRRQRQEYSDSDSNTSYGSSRHRLRNRIFPSGQTHASSSHTSEEGKRGGLGRLLKFPHDKHNP